MFVVVRLVDRRPLGHLSDQRHARKLQESKIKNGSLEEEILGKYMVLGVGLTQTAANLNTNRKKRTPPRTR